MFSSTNEIVQRIQVKDRISREQMLDNYLINSTFPHHLHDGEEENVVSHKEPEGLEILLLIIWELNPISHH